MPRMDGQQPRRHAQRDVERQPRQIRLADQQEILVDKGRKCRETAAEPHDKAQPDLLRPHPVVVELSVANPEQLSSEDLHAISSARQGAPLATLQQPRHAVAQYATGEAAAADQQQCFHPNRNFRAGIISVREGDTVWIGRIPSPGVIDIERIRESSAAPCAKYWFSRS